MRFISAVFVTTVASALISNVPTARADAHARWLVIPVALASHLASHEDRANTDRIVTELESELVRRDQSVLPNQDAAILFAARQSSEPTALNTEQLAHLLRSALEERAKQPDPALERKRIERAVKALDALDPLTRDRLLEAPDAARRLFAACLTRAHLLAIESNDGDAVTQMAACLELFPGFELSSGSTAQLNDLFARAQQRLLEQPHGSLVVHSGHPCALRLNGVALTTTPATLSPVAAGVARVQLECSGRSGRVHAVEVPADQEASCEIDDAFDAAVHTAERLTLTYDKKDTRDARMDADASVIAHVVSVDRTLLFVVDEERKTIRLRASDRGDVAVLPLGASATSHGLAAAVRTLVGPASSAAPQRSALDTSEAQYGLGIALGLGGVGALALSVGLYAGRLRVRDHGYGHAASPAALLIIGGAGAGLLGTAEFLGLPEHAGVPPWAWFLGSVGATTMAAGATLALLAPRCEIHRTPRCDGPTDDRLFGVFLGVGALPLLSVPLVYALRPRRATPFGLRARFERIGASFELTGAF